MPADEVLVSTPMLWCMAIFAVFGVLVALRAVSGAVRRMLGTKNVTRASDAQVVTCEKRRERRYY